jgi:ribonuclease HII
LNRLIGGIDEAGRGSLFGPLVISGISVSRDKISILREMNVRDSKLLSPKRREHLYPEILKLADNVFSVRILPNEIDEAITKRIKTLNYLEAEYMAKVADMLGASTIFIDASDTDERRFGRIVKQNMKSKARIVSKHHMDEKNIVVSAASIVAKVERDNEISKLRRKFGDFGSGYPSDIKTRKYIIQRIGSGINIDCVRMSWKTVSRLLSPVDKKKIQVRGLYQRVQV